MPVNLTKDIVAPELAEIVLYEIAWRDAMLAAHAVLAKAAVSAASKVLARRREKPIDEALVDEALDAVAGVYERDTEDKVRAAIGKLVERIYRAAKAVAWRRAMGAIPEPAVYDFGVVQKSVEPPWRRIDVQDSQRDDASRSRLKRFNVFWASTFFDRILRGKLHARVTERLSSDLNGREASREIRQILTEELDSGPAWPGGSAENYFGLVAASSTTTVRAAASLRAMQDAGVGYLVWRTAQDERVCSRCGAMDDRRVPIDLVEAQADAHLSARTAAELEAASPWYSETEFVGIIDEADAASDSAGALAERGVAAPPLHALCRCSLDYDSMDAPTFGPDADAVHALLREVIAGVALGGLDGLTGTQRATTRETVGGIAPWLDRVEVQVVSASVLPLALDEAVLKEVSVASDGRRVFVTEDAMDAASSGEFNAIAYGVGHVALKQIGPSAEALNALYANARQKHLLIDSAIPDAETYFARGFEAYMETAASDGRIDREKLSRIDSALFAVIDKIVQARVILGASDVLSLVALTAPRAAKALTDGEANVLNVLRDALNSADAESFIALQSRLAAALSPLSDSAREHAANAYVSIGMRRGWLK